jgi:uncharacterized protein YukE
MTQIRVTPSELRDAANRLQELADRVRQLGHEALDAAESAPSYDGQFGPQVESMGAEAQALTTKQADRLGALSDQLLIYANEFEQADLESMDRLAGLNQFLHEWLAKLNLPSGQAGAGAPFPAWLVDWYLRLGFPGGVGITGGATAPSTEAPWWAPIAVGGSDFWNRAVEGGQGLVNLGWYELFRASQASGELVDLSKELDDIALTIPGYALDALVYGFPSAQGPPTGVTGQLWVSGLDRQSLLSSHQHQYDGTESTPNDCATTSMSMVINQAFSVLGYPDSLTQHGDLAPMLDSAPGEILRLYRVPEGFPGIHLLGIDAEPQGAMPPLGAAAALNMFADEMEETGFPRPWTAELRGQSTPQDLVANLQEGKPTMIFGVGSGIPHARVLAGYDGANDVWSILDPGYPYDSNAPAQFLQISTAELEKWWGEWYFAYERNTMVVLTLGAGPGPVSAPLLEPNIGSPQIPE